MLAALRRSAVLARLVLGWMVLSLGVAVASPLVQPQAIDWVCTGTTVKAVVMTDDGAVELGAQHLDCPLCLPMGALPPPMLAVPLPLRVALRVAPPPPVATAPGVLVRRWLARGPPLTA